MSINWRLLWRVLNPLDRRGGYILPHTIVACLLGGILALSGAFAVHLIRHGGYRPSALPTRTLHLSGARTPASHSLAKYIVRRHNQGTGNSCVAQTITEGLELYTNEAGHPTWLSTGYLYNPIAPYGQTLSYAQAFDRAEGYGIAPYRDFPNDAVEYWLQPGYVQLALNYRVTSWYNVASTDRATIEALIAGGHPLAVATAVHDTLYYHGPGNAWVWSDTGSLHFYHSQLIVGYNQSGVAVLNSWPNYGVNQIVWWSWSFLGSAASVWNGGAVAVFYPSFSISRPKPAFPVYQWNAYRLAHRLKPIPYKEHGKLTWAASIFRSHPHIGGIESVGSWHPHHKHPYMMYPFRYASVTAWPAWHRYQIHRHR